MMPCGPRCKVIIDCSSAPAKLAVLRDLVIAGWIKDKEDLEAYGELGMKIDDLVEEFVNNHVNDPLP
jgi:hypothetical protein